MTMGIIKTFGEFIKENIDITEIFDENKEALKRFFDFLLEANKRPNAKYHLAINTNNDPVWNGEIEERYRHIWEKFVNQLKQLSAIPLRVVENVVDEEGNCIDPNFRNILVDLDEEYVAEFDEDDLTFNIPAESFIDEEGNDNEFIKETLLNVTEEGYEPKNTYEESSVKKFSRAVNEEAETSDFPEEVPSNMPEEFTGDPKTDPYLAAAIYRHKEDKSFVNTNVSSNSFNPYAKAQVEGNKYNEVWQSLVKWIKKGEDNTLQGLTIPEKDRVLLSTFKSILNRQKGLYDYRSYLRELQRNEWKTYNYNRCKEKWIKYTEMAKKVYPGKDDSFRRSQFRRERYESFIRKEGIEKYAKSWIPGFSRAYDV